MRKLLLVSFLLLSPLTAGTIIHLDFEGLRNTELILGYYDGGLGSLGSGPGPDYGITFGSDSLAVISWAAGGSGSFDGAPSMPTALTFASGPGAVMNVPGGFTAGLWFSYSAIFRAGTVSIYSGVNGSGSKIAELDLPMTPSGGPGCHYPYCPWTDTGVRFSGVARSVTFGGTARYIGFDNMELGTPWPTPEPGPWALLGSGLGMLALGHLRKR